MGKRGKKTQSYTPAPAISPEVAPRAQAVLKVLTGQWRVTAAAAELGMSRNRFQTLMHRSLEAMLAELGQKPAGRPALPARQRQLESENTHLRRENEQLQGRVGTIDRLLGVASDMLKGRIEASGRQGKTSRSSTSTSGTSSKEGNNDPEDAGGDARRKLDGAEQLRHLGLGPRLAAAVVGVSPSTVRRWVAARRSGQPLRRRCGPARTAPEPALVSKAVEIVRELHGLVGAASLGRSTGLSRRQAAAVKRAEQTAMERDRKVACTHVVITTPGIVRGFDQMYVWTEDGWRFPLVSADAAVPYRTSILVVDAYDEAGVLEALARDFGEAGAPLVWRRDRHSTHRTDAVGDLLESNGVLVLQGPAYYPRFYGQLERQNRDHRAWLDDVGILPAATLQLECDQMKAALNDRWRRRNLAWRTPTELWQQRPQITKELRDSFRQEVYNRAARIERHLDHDNELAMRLAIEQALTQRGYLRLERGVGAN
jgi:hypothetical protein